MVTMGEAKMADPPRSHGYGGFQHYTLTQRWLEPPPRLGEGEVASRVHRALQEYEKKFQKFRSFIEIFQCFEKIFYYR